MENNLSQSQGNQNLEPSQGDNSTKERDESVKIKVFGFVLIEAKKVTWSLIALVAIVIALFIAYTLVLQRFF